MQETGETLPSFFEVIEQGDEDACRALWLGVILQAILDAKGKYGNLVTKSHAKVWLEGRGGEKSDFAAVCQLAGVDFTTTRNRCAALVAEDSAPVDFRTMKRELDHNRTAANRKRYFTRTRKRQQERLEGLISSAANDNHPAPANDNRSEYHGDNSINQPEENHNDQ